MAASSNGLSGSRTVGAILVVAAAYYISGWLGLLLAVPPGYATAVWPAYDEYQSKTDRAIPLVVLDPN